MTTPLDRMAALSATFGFPPVRRTVPGPYDCPTHHTPLQTHQLSAFNGWHQVHTCPQFDGTCSYDPAAETEQVDEPADVAAAAEAQARADAPKIKIIQVPPST